MDLAKEYRANINVGIDILGYENIYILQLYSILYSSIIIEMDNNIINTLTLMGSSLYFEYVSEVLI